MKRNLLFPMLSLLLVLTVAFSLTLGKYPIMLNDIGNFFLMKMFGAGSRDPERYSLLESLLLEIRMPRIIAAILIGASLAVAGTAFQAMFVNPSCRPPFLASWQGPHSAQRLAWFFSKTGLPCRS
jgi:iron complex transport system permease protein